jgi:hypothetical protein
MFDMAESQSSSREQLPGIALVHHICIEKKAITGDSSMKTLLITLSIFLISITGFDKASGQDTEAKMADIPMLGGTAGAPKHCAISNYALGLRSDNAGLTESCLYYAVQLRVSKPDLDLGLLEREIDALVAGGKTLSIRRKAALASIIFASPSLVELPPHSTAPGIDNFFASLNEQITARLVVMK